MIQQKHWRALALLVLFAFPVRNALAQSPVPAIFYSDLEGGPNQGGENAGGAYVTIYGKGFGASQGTSSVTIGGGAAAKYSTWSDTKIAFQLGAAARSGNIAVTTSAGTSNGVPFTVRAGNIYFVATNGTDGGTGAFTSPWQTLLKARNSMASGDIVYAMNGVSQVTDDGTGWDAAITLGAIDCGGTLPRAMVAYPGAIATIGTVTGPSNGIRASNPSERGGSCTGNWVFAGFLMRGTNAGLVLEGPSSGWRVVGNDMTCPNGDGASACVETSMASNIKFYGNNVHDTGKVNASALYHGVYFSTDSNHIDMGWSTVANVRGCRGVQVHSSPLNGGGANDPTGHNQFDLIFHDNIIHDTQCDGIILATVDPSQGQVQVYNNIIYNAGKGPNNPEGSGNWACVYAPGYTNTGPVGGGTVEVYNNTLYNCGTFATPPYGNSNGGVMNGGHNAALRMRVRNNIINTPAAIPYLLAADANGNPCANLSVCTGIFGSNNLFFGNGAAPANSNITTSVNADPLFVNVAGHDFHLQASSPARGAGINTGLTTDFDGVLRGASFDIGALEQAAGTAVLTSVLNVAPVALTFTAAAGGAQPLSQIITITNTGLTGASYTITGSPSLLKASPAGGVLGVGGVQVVTISADFTGLALGTYNGTIAISGGSNGTQTVGIQYIQNPPNIVPPTLISLVNAASYQAQAVSPAQVVSLFGINMGPSQGVAGAQDGTTQFLQTLVANTQVVIDGVAAPLLYVQAGQINAIVPQSVQGKSVIAAQVVYKGTASLPLNLTVAPTSPGVFTVDYSGRGAAVALNANGVLVTTGTPAIRGTVVSIYTDGLGFTGLPFSDGQTISVSTGAKLTPTVTISGFPATVSFAGLVPGFIAGVYRIDVLVPMAVVPGTANVIVSSNGVPAATVTLEVR